MALIVGTNSLGSREEADAYFADSLRSAFWSAYNGTLKDQGLVEATRVLERQGWQGSKEVPEQVLSFPRTQLTCRGESVTPEDSLALAKEAQFEYALALLMDPSMLNNTDATGTNTKRLKAGSAEIEFFRSTRGTRFPVIIQDIIGCFLDSGLAFSGGITPEVSGTDAESSFDDPRKYGLTEGL